MIFRLRGVALFGRGNQLDADQPGGNGTNGQIVWLSLAAFGGSWAGVFAGGAGGVDRSARRRQVHCKFMYGRPGLPML